MFEPNDLSPFYGTTVYRAKLHNVLHVPNVASLKETIVSDEITPSGSKISMQLKPGFLEVKFLTISNKTHYELIPLASVFSLGMTK